MYEEKRVRFNWKGFFVKLLIILVVLVLIIKFLPINGGKLDANGHTKVFNNNLTKLKEVGNSYFNKDNLPKGDDEVKVTLKQLIKANKIKTLKGADKKVCNEDASYVKSYKKSIGYELEVYLECSGESETSHIYLGCYDGCSKTTTTTTTKVVTTKKSKNKSNSGNSSNTNTVKTTRRATTTTTTRIKKFVVIFNENGGSKISTQSVNAGNMALKPIDPVKNGYKFVGWYYNNSLYDFNKPVTENIVLIAKWELNKDVKTLSYTDTIYSVLSTYNEANEVNTKSILKVPDNINEFSNIKVKSVTYIKNIATNDDVSNYLNNRNKFFDYEETSINNISINNFGTLDNIELSKYVEGTNDRAVKWNGLVNSKCNNPVNNTCVYGIVYRVVWEYNI